MAIKVEIKEPAPEPSGGAVGAGFLLMGIIFAWNPLQLGASVTFWGAFICFGLTTIMVLGGILNAFDHDGPRA